MASPQTENGYIKIANELVEALTKLRIPGEANQVLFHIFRKTYGFNKVEDSISLSQFALATGLKKNAVCRAIDKLKLLNLIHQKEYPTGNLYRFNKDFDTWKPFTKKGSPPKRERGVHQKENKQSPKKSTTIDSKYNLTKDTAAKPLDNVNVLINIFQKINPGINYANLTNRKAAEWLLDKYGLEKAVATSEYAALCTGKQYAPTITTPHQLKENLGKLIAFFKRDSLENKTSKHLKL